MAVAAAATGVNALSTVLGLLTTYSDRIQDRRGQSATLQRTLNHLNFFLTTSSDYWIGLCTENAKEEIEELRSLIEEAEHALDQRERCCAWLTNCCRPSCEYFNQQISTLSKAILDSFSPISRAEIAFTTFWDNALNPKKDDAANVLNAFAAEFEVSPDYIRRHLVDAGIPLTGQVSCAVFYDSIRHVRGKLPDYFRGLTPLPSTPAPPPPSGGPVNPPPNPPPPPSSGAPGDTQPPDDTEPSGDTQTPNDTELSGDTQTPDDTQPYGDTQTPDHTHPSGGATD